MTGFEAIGGIIACITLFLFAIKRLSIAFEDLFTDRAKLILQNYTSNLTKSILVGILITLLLDSSSAVIILTIIFINAGTLDLRRGIGIALGANIGTTIQSQIYAFDFMQYSFVLMFIGLIHIFTNNPKTRNYFSAIFFIGMLFFSLFLIGEFTSQPDVFAYIKEWLYDPDRSYVLTAIGGGFFTVVIQSSGAMVGLAIILAKEGLMTSSTGIAIMMGAELGTTSNTLVAAIGSKRHAVQLTLFNFLFNTITISLGLIFFSNFIELIEYLFSEYSIPRKIANAHILFNIIGVILIIPLINPYVTITSNPKFFKVKENGHDGVKAYATDHNQSTY